MFRKFDIRMSTPSTPSIVHKLSKKMDCSTIREILSFTRTAKFVDTTYNLLFNFLPNEMINHVNSYVTEEIIVCSTENDGIILINSSTGDIIKRIETLPDQVKQKIIISDDAKILIYCGYTDYEVDDEIDENGVNRPHNNLLLVWDLETNTPILRMTEHRVTAIALSNDNKNLIFSSYDYIYYGFNTSHNIKRNIISIMNLSSKSIFKTIDHENRKHINHISLSLETMKVVFSHDFSRPKIFVWSLQTDQITEKSLIEYYTPYVPNTVMIAPHLKKLKFIKGVDGTEILYCETNTVALFINVNNIENITIDFNKTFNTPVSSATLTNVNNNILTNVAISHLSIDITQWSHKLKGEDIRFAISKPLTQWISNIGMSSNNKSLVFNYRNNLEYYSIHI
jgi:hypothetical protein